jgi:hypothetical protein
MKNGRCRMHGGKSTGAPKGNQNAGRLIYARAPSHIRYGAVVDYGAGTLL